MNITVDYADNAACVVFWYDKQIRRANNRSFQEKQPKSSENTEPNLPILQLLPAHFKQTTEPPIPSKMKIRDSLL